MPEKKVEYNINGLTYQQWALAAGLKSWALGYPAYYSAWKRGVDAADFKATRELLGVDLIAFIKQKRAPHVTP